MGQEIHYQLSPKRIGQYRDEAKELLRAVRGGEEEAVRRARQGLGDRFEQRFVLADALHVLALEHGYRSWPACKRELEAELEADDGVRAVARIGAAPAAAYAGWAERLLVSARRQDEEAVGRLRAQVPRLSDEDGAAIAAAATVEDARLCLAREYGFRTWQELTASADGANQSHYSRLPESSPWKRAVAAIRAGDAAGLERLLAEHPGLELEDPGMTLLGAAAQPEAGEVSRALVDLLVEAGSELDVPLNLAACFDKAAMVGWLLDAGADATATPVWGITPLQTAVYHGSRAAADLLVARTGLHPDALYLAAAAGDLDRLAAWFGADGELAPAALRERPNLADVGWPPQAPPSGDPADALAEALALAAQIGRRRACEALLERGTDPARAPLYGVTPLHFAVSMDRRETVELLVSRGAPLRARDRIHRGTPLEWARHNGHTDPALLRLLGG